MTSQSTPWYKRYVITLTTFSVLSETSNKILGRLSLKNIFAPIWHFDDVVPELWTIMCFSQFRWHWPWPVWHHDVLSILLYFLTYFLTLWPTIRLNDVLFSVTTYFVTSQRTSWRHDVLFDIMTYFWRYIVFLDIIQAFDVMTYLWRHDVLLDIMEYFTYITFCYYSITVHTFGRYDVPFDCMTFLLTSWRTFHTYWCHDVFYDIMTHFLKSSRTFHTRCHDALLHVIQYFLHHDVLSILFDVMT